MKRIYTVFFLFCFLVSLAGCNKKDNAADEKSTSSDNENVVTEAGSLNTDSDNIATDDNTAVNEEDLKSLSEGFALQMVEDNFDDFYNRFSKTMKAAMSKEKLKDTWDATVASLGNYIEIYNSSESTKGNYQAVDVILRYKYNGLKVSFVYNKSTELDGLWMAYSPIEEAAADTDTYSETKITFGGSDYPITGILTLPKGVTNPPVAILVPGSGTHDVNETVGANKPFQDLAWGLAEQGIASIRYNERVLLYPELGSGEYTIQTDSLDDASNAIKYALSSDQIDKDNIFIIGHSLGAMMAPKIASDHPEVAGIVLLAGSPRKLEDIVYDQVQDQIDHTPGVTDVQAKKALSDTEDAILKIRSLTKGGTQALLGSPASYWYSLNQINIADLSTKLSIPIFIAQGSADFQVYADKDYKAWQDLLGDKKNVTFKLYNNLNHLFMTTNGKTDVTEYNTPSHVDQMVIDDIAAWMKGN